MPAWSSPKPPFARRPSTPRALPWPSARAWPSSTAATSMKWSSASAPATMASTPTNGCWATPKTTRSPCTSWAPTTPGCGAARRTNGSAIPPASTGATTMPRISPFASRPSPIRAARPSTSPTCRPFATWHGRICTASIAARSTSSSRSWPSAPRRWSAPAPWTPKSPPPIWPRASWCGPPSASPTSASGGPTRAAMPRTTGCIHPATTCSAARTARQPQTSRRKHCRQAPAVSRPPTRTASGRGGFCRLPMPTPGLRPVQSPITVRFSPTISPRRWTRGAPCTAA